MNVKVLLAEDQQIIRQGLRALLDREKDMTVVGEAADGRSALEQAHKLAPQVVLMDIAMPGLNGVEATRRLLSELPRVKVIALSVHAEEQFVSEMLRAGAAGYLIKDCAVKELAEAIRTVMGGQTYLSPSIAAVVARGLTHRGRRGQSSVFAILTPREREVLQLLAEGLSTKQIALRLKLSVKTAETHRRNIMEKLELRSVAELTKYAVREGLTDLQS